MGIALSQVALRRALRARRLRLRLLWRLEDLTVFFVLAGVAAAGAKTPASTGIVDGENKSAAPNNSALQEIFLTAVPLKCGNQYSYYNSNSGN